MSLLICELCFSVGQATSEVARRRCYHVVFVPFLSVVQDGSIKLFFFFSDFSEIFLFVCQVPIYEIDI